MTQSNSYYVDIELSSPLTRGYNIVDIEGDLQKTPNVRVCEKVDTKEFKKTLIEVLSAIQ